MDRPAPPVDVYNKPFWEGLRWHVIRVPKCEECGHVQYPMGPVCSACLGRTFDWVALSGCGEIWGFAIYHHVFHPGFAAEVPYNVSMITLAEGPQIASNVVGIANEELRTGMAVVAEFDDLDAELTLLKFRPSAD